MNVVPGSSFFQTVPGSAAGPDTARPAQGGNQLLQAQAVEESKSAGRPDRGEAPRMPYGPRGHLIDIIA